MTKVTSDSQNTYLLYAGVDKLDVYFTSYIETSQLKAKLKELNFEFKLETLRDRKRYLHVWSDDKSIYFSLNYKQDCITGFTSNPNRFKKWPTYLNFIESIIPIDVIQTARIQRLDLNIDFSIPFLDLIQKIDIKNKSTKSSYDEKSGERTGIYFGKGSELIVVYDKSLKENLSTPHSRIELRFKSNKVPTRSIYNLPDKLKNNDYFTSLICSDLTFCKNPLSEDQKSRVTEFKSILKREGLYSARKAMNKTRNFDRDFKKILKLEPWVAQPIDLFKSEIRQFLEPSMQTLKLIH